jgi:hypothetical protein
LSEFIHCFFFWNSEKGLRNEKAAILGHIYDRKGRSVIVQHDVKLPLDILFEHGGVLVPVKKTNRLFCNVWPFNKDVGFAKSYLRFPPLHSVVGELRSQNAQVDLEDLSSVFKDHTCLGTCDYKRLSDSVYECETTSLSTNVCPAVAWLLPITKGRRSGRHPEEYLHIWFVALLFLCCCCCHNSF